MIVKPKKSKIILWSMTIMILASLFQSCKDCSGFACFTPAEQFSFNLIDKDTGADIFQRDSLTLEDITITNSNGKRHELEMDTFFAGEHFIIDSEIGWETGEELSNYILKIKDQEYDLIYWTEERNRDCCTFFEQISLSLEGESNIERNDIDIFTLKI